VGKQQSSQILIFQNQPIGIITAPGKGTRGRMTDREFVHVQSRMAAKQNRVELA